MRPIEEIKATRNLFIETEAPNDGMGGCYYDSISNKRLNFIFSYQMGWEHLSVSMPSRTPTWEQMCKMKDIFWGKDEACVEYHPKEEDYVNNHQHCLHIWKPTDVELPTPPSILVGFRDVELPTPPSILVGFRNEEEKQAFLQMANMFGVQINKWNYNKRDKGVSNEK